MFQNVIELRRKQINDYMSSIELNESSISVSRIKSDLQSILNEKPGVELNYKTETMIKEDGSKIKKTDKLESINIFYTFEDNEGPHYDKLTYFI